MKVNSYSLIVGPKQHGKSSLARTLAKKRMLEGATLFAHDPTSSWSLRWGLRPIRNAAEWRALQPAQRRAGVSWRGSNAELLALVRELGAKFNTADHARFPMAVVYDEASIVETSGATYQGREDLEVAAIAAHLGTAFVWNLQRATMLPEQFYDFATDVYLFRVSARRMVRLIEDRCDLPEGILEPIRSLPPHRYVHVRPGLGVVEDPL